MKSILIWNKTIEFLRPHWLFILFVAICTICLAWLNHFIWPVNDEYLYAIIGKAIYSSLAYKSILLSDLSTEHTPLLGFIIAGFYALTKIDGLNQLRFLTILFSIGTLILFYAILLQAKLDKKIAVAILCLLFLIPDFWVYSERLTLDMPILFTFTLLVYFLIKKSSLTKISLALLLMFWFKEYYFYLVSGFLFIYYGIIFLLQYYKKPWIALGKLAKTLGIILWPSVLMIFLMLNFNFLPYPRLLETSLNDLFGDLFLYSQKIFQFSFDSSESTIQMTGTVPQGIYNSSIEETTVNPVQALSYNFSDIFINPLVLIFFLLGFVQRIFSSIKNWKQIEKIRIDIVFILLVSIFIFFDIQQGGTMHGFRIFLPMILGMLYFAYFGFHSVLVKPKKNTIFLSIFIFIFVMYLYLVNTFLFEYQSVLLSTGIIAKLIFYKPYIFLFVFFVIFIFILLYSRIKISKKLKITILVMIIIGFWALRFIPYYINSHSSEEYFGYHYSLPKAQSLLEEIKGDGLITNMYFHKVFYLSNNYELQNNHCYPIGRTFTKLYPRGVFTLGQYYETDNLVAVADNKVKYVFLYREFFGEEYQKGMQEFEDRYKPYLVLIKEYQVNGQQQWVLYRFKYKKYLKDFSK